MQTHSHSENVIARRKAHGSNAGVYAEARVESPLPDLRITFGFDPDTLTREFYRARQTIFRHHDNCDDICVIETGWACRHLQLADGRRQILAILLPGDVISAASLFAPRLDFAVQALTDVTFHRIRREQLRARFDQPRLVDEIANILAAERSAADALIVDLGRRHAGERIARLILRLRDRLHSRGEATDETFLFPLRQQHIADSTGLTSVHVSRVMTELRKDGLLDVGGGTMRVHNLAELRRRAELQ